MHPLHASQRVLERIYLVGFMGAGKSTVGRLLAAHIGWSFLDLDAAIEARHGKKVAELFETQGEASFRILEANELLLARRDRQVLALGGGAIETNRVREALRSDLSGYLIFLAAPFDVLVNRCLTQDQGMSRPLLQSRFQLQERFRSRLPHYQKAHLTVATEDESPEDIAALIHRHLAALLTNA